MNRVSRINTIAIVSAIVVVMWFLYVFYNLFVPKAPSLSNQPYPNVVWAKGTSWQGASAHAIEGFAVSRDHIYMSGTLEDGGQHLNYDGLVVKLDVKTGQMVHFKRYKDDVLGVQFTRITVDPKTGFLYLWTAGDQGLRLQKIDTDGKTMWSKPAKAASFFLTLLVGPNGNIYLIEEGTYPVEKPYARKNPIYVRSSEGKALWQIEAYRISDVAFDADSNIYVAGEIIDDTDAYPAILSFDKNGGPRWSQAVKDATDSAKINLVMDTRKDIINVIIKTPGDQQDVWQKHSTSGELVDSQPIGIKADAAIGGEDGNIYFFEKDAGQVNLQKYSRSRKLLATSKYDRKLFLTQEAIGQGLMVSKAPDKNGQDTIFAFSESIISRLKQP